VGRAATCPLITYGMIRVRLHRIIGVEMVARNNVRSQPCVSTVADFKRNHAIGSRMAECATLLRLTISLPAVRFRALVFGAPGFDPADDLVMRHAGRAGASFRQRLFDARRVPGIHFDVGGHALAPELRFACATDQPISERETSAIEPRTGGIDSPGLKNIASVPRLRSRAL